MDQSFIAQLSADDKTAAIVRSIISLGENLGLDVIAEGVETAEQLDYLQRVNCPYAQGFLFARPMEPKAAAGILQGTNGRSEARTLLLPSVPAKNITHLESSRGPQNCDESGKKWVPKPPKSGFHLASVENFC